MKKTFAQSRTYENGTLLEKFWIQIDGTYPKEVSEDTFYKLESDEFVDYTDSKKNKPVVYKPAQNKNYQKDNCKKDGMDDLDHLIVDLVDKIRSASCDEACAIMNEFVGSLSQGCWEDGYSIALSDIQKITNKLKYKE